MPWPRCARSIASTGAASFEAIDGPLQVLARLPGHADEHDDDTGRQPARHRAAGAARPAAAKPEVARGAGDARGRGRAAIAAGGARLVARRSRAWRSCGRPSDCPGGLPAWRTPRPGWRVAALAHGAGAMVLSVAVAAALVSRLRRTDLDRGRGRRAAVVSGRPGRDRAGRLAGWPVGRTRSAAAARAVRRDPGRAAHARGGAGHADAPRGHRRARQAARSGMRSPTASRPCSSRCCRTGRMRRPSRRLPMHRCSTARVPLWNHSTSVIRRMTASRCASCCCIAHGAGRSRSGAGPAGNAGAASSSSSSSCWPTAPRPARRSCRSARCPSLHRTCATWSRLNSGTVLPPGALRALVGIAAHPLNRPRLDEHGRVIGGWTILQPRVEPLRYRSSRPSPGTTSCSPRRSADEVSPRARRCINGCSAKACTRAAD